MTKREAENYAHLRRAALDALGLSSDDFEALLRIEKTLHRWAERECNGEVEVDEDGTAYGTNAGYCTSGVATRWKVANRERGALKRLAAIMARYPKLGAYHQGDPRGCALYVYPKARHLEMRVGCKEQRCFCHDPTDRREHPCSSCGCSVPPIDSCYSSVGVGMCFR